MTTVKIMISLITAAFVISSIWLLGKHGKRYNKPVRFWKKAKPFAQDIEDKFHDFFEDFHKEYKNQDNENIHWDERVNL